MVRILVRRALVRRARRQPSASPASAPSARRRARPTSRASPARRHAPGRLRRQQLGRHRRRRSRRGTFKRLARINVIPDYEARMAEIAANPYRLAYFLAIRDADRRGPRPVRRRHVLLQRRQAGRDLAAVVRRRRRRSACETGKIKWRFPVAGVRSDHMAVSPDGRRVVVSASTGNVVHVLRMRDGKEVGKFRPAARRTRASTSTAASGSCTPASARSTARSTSPACPTRSKGSGCCRSSNAKTFKIERRYNLRKALDERGLKDVSIAVRPMTLSPDEKKIYFQLSFFHGFVEMDRRDREDHPRHAAAQPDPEPAAGRATCSTPRTTASR